MSLKRFPATFGLYVITLAVKSGGRRRVRNIKYGISSPNPDTDAFDVLEQIKAMSLGRVISIRKSLGRAFLDASGALQQEPVEPYRAQCLLQSDEDPKYKTFLNIPWIQSTTSVQDVKDSFSGQPFARLQLVNTVTSGVADPDIPILTKVVRWADVGQLLQEEPMEEKGDDDNDSASGYPDGII